MKEEIRITKEIAGGTALEVVEVKKLTVNLNEETMQLITAYKGATYPVLGNSFFQYIVIQ